MKPVIQKSFGSIYKNWKIARFPEYVFFQEGPGLRRWQWTNDGMKVVNVKNIRADGGIDLSNSDRYISREEFVQRYSHFAIEDGDVLVASSGNTYGKVARIQAHHLPLMMNTSVIRFHPLSPTSLNQDFLFAFLRSDLFRNQVESFVIGSAQPNFGPSHLKRMEIPLPPLSTQRKIGAILSNYDDLIENNTRRIKILEEMAQTIYREWFVEFRFPGYENVRMVESELGLIPQEWQIKKLSSLVETQYGYTESATEDKVGPKFVRGKDVNKTSYINWDSVPFCPINCEKYAKYRLHVNDILVIRMADPGKVAIVENDVEAVFASYLIRLNLTSNLVSPYYLFYSLLDRRYQDYIYGASTGTTRKSASAGVITDFDFVIPTSEVRDSFETVIALLRKGINNLLDKNANLRKTRDLLLPKLISGELDVSDLDINTDTIQ